MTGIYVVCLVVGGALVVLSIFAGGDADADFEADLAPEVEGDVDVEVDGEGVAAAARFLSVRNLVFGAAFFGLTGTTFTLLGVPEPVTLGAAIGTGALAAGILHRLMGYLRDSESGTPASLTLLEGAVAEVVVGFAGSARGKVAVEAGDGTQQLVARRHEQAEAEGFAAGDRVLIVHVDAGEAQVAETTFLSRG